jgi:hypothetical protein
LKPANVSRDRCIFAAVQRCSYQKEAELIGFFGIPALHETPDDIQRSRETFAGFKEKDQLAGVISYEKKGYDLVICKADQLGFFLIRAALNRRNFPRGLFLCML